VGAEVVEAYTDRKIKLVSKPFNKNFLGKIYTDSRVNDLEWELVIPESSICREWPCL
jgi:hypothetical protein